MYLMGWVVLHSLHAAVFGLTDVHSYIAYWRDSPLTLPMEPFPMDESDRVGGTYIGLLVLPMI